MEVLYVTKDELNDIENENIFEKETVEKLFNAGIYVKDNSTDDAAISALREQHASISGAVDIMYLITTQKCNLKCSYCFLENNPNRNVSLPFMTTDTAKTAIYKFAKYLMNNNKAKATIIFYGGEPMLQKDVFVESVKYAQAFPIHWDFSVITNGTLLDEEIVRFCAENHVTIGLSLDGPKFLHDLNRRYRVTNEPSYDDCIQAKSLLDKYHCPYGLSITLSKDALRYGKELTEWLFNNHEGEVYFNLLHFSTIDETAAAYINAAIRFMIHFYEKCEESGFKLKEGRIQRQIDSFREQKFVFSDCGAVGCHQITVVPNGQTCICHGDSGNTKYHLGTLDDKMLFNLINTPHGKAWADYSTLSDVECLRCPAIFCCGRGCPQHAENLFGNRNYKDQNFCTYIRSVLNWLLIRGFHTL